MSRPISNLIGSIETKPPSWYPRDDGYGRVPLLDDDYNLLINCKSAPILNCECKTGLLKMFIRAHDHGSSIKVCFAHSDLFYDQLAESKMTDSERYMKKMLLKIDARLAKLESLEHSIKSMVGELDRVHLARASVALMDDIKESVATKGF